MKLTLAKSKGKIDVTIRSFHQTVRTGKGKLTLDKNILIQNIIGFDYTFNFSFQ